MTHIITLTAERKNSLLKVFLSADYHTAGQQDRYSEEFESPFVTILRSYLVLNEYYIQVTFSGYNLSGEASVPYHDHCSFF